MCEETNSKQLEAAVEIESRERLARERPWSHSVSGLPSNSESGCAGPPTVIARNSGEPCIGLSQLCGTPSSDCPRRSRAPVCDGIVAGFIFGRCAGRRLRCQ